MALTTFNVVTGLTQAPMGFLVDRVGPRLVLMAGLCLGGLAFAMLGLWTTYPVLIAAALFAGLANCVYHPADYALLANAIPEHRVGRAFSVHTFAGFAGGALAPPILLGVAAYAGLAAALLVAGLVGPAVAGLSLLRSKGEIVAHTKARTIAEGAGKRAPLGILNASIIGLTGFFTLLALSSGGIQSFSVVALLATQRRNARLRQRRADRPSDLRRDRRPCRRLPCRPYRLPRLRCRRRLRAHDRHRCGHCHADPARRPDHRGLGLAGFCLASSCPRATCWCARQRRPVWLGALSASFPRASISAGLSGRWLFGWIMDNTSPRWVFGASAIFMAVTAAFWDRQ